MKKNTKTYILLAVVGIIWGTIGYKIVSSLNPDPPTKSITETPDFKPLTINKKKDTFSISADYRDPFLGTLPRKAVKRKSVAKPKKAPEPELEIKFTGVITDHDTNKKIYFVSFNGQQHLMSPSDEIEKVKLLSGTSSTIRIRHNNKTRTIKLQE